MVVLGGPSYGDLLEETLCRWPPLSSIDESGEAAESGIHYAVRKSHGIC